MAVTRLNDDSETKIKAFRSVLRMVVGGWALLTRAERMAAAAIAVASMVASVVELVALSTVVPFVGLLMGRHSVVSFPVLDRIVDTIGVGKGDDLFLWLGFLTMASLVFAFVCRFGVLWVVASYSVHITNRMMRETMRGCLKAPYVWLRSENGARLAERIAQDTSAAGQGIFPVVLEILYGLFVLLIGVGAILATAPWQAIIVIAFLGLIGMGVLSVLNPLAARYSARMRRHKIDSTRFAVEAFSGRKLIKASRAELFFAERYAKAYEMANRARRNQDVVNTAIPTGTLLLGQLGMLSLALALVLSNLPTETVVAHLTFILLILTRVLPSVSSMTGAFNKLVKNEPYFRGFLDLWDRIQPWAVAGPLGAGGAHSRLDWKTISLVSVSFGYPGSDVPQVVDVSCTIERGRSYGLVGPSGAGKSTLTDLVLGLLFPDRGELRIDGRTLDEEVLKVWLSAIGYVPQEPYVLDDTVRRNVAFGIADDAIDDEAVWRALVGAELEDVVRAWPEELDTILGDAGSRLSGGQRQRIAIARALYRGATFLILDEATNALDSVTEDSINDTVRAIPGLTSLIVAHRMSALRSCDSILLMKDGRLVATGTYDSLAATNALFRRLARHGAGARTNNPKPRAVGDAT